MHALAWWPTLAAVLVATITDFRSRKIPNWLVFPFMLSGIAVSTFLHGFSGAGSSFRGMALGAAVCGVLAYLHALGMGDLKLCAAIGAWIGPCQLVNALVLTGLAGGVFALGWALSGNFVGEIVRNSCSLVGHFFRRGIVPHPELVLANPKARRMPYAPAIAIGTLISFFVR
jgi:prepilin peptidase CpaA